MNTDIIIGFIGLVISVMAFIITLQKKSEVKNILFIAFVFRIFFALLYTYQGEYDVDGYQDVAESLMQGTWIDFFTNFQTGAYLYSWFVAAIWRITGVSLFLIRIINAFLSYYCCVLGYELSKMIFNDEKKSKKVLLIIALFPNLLRFSAYFTSRETLFVFLLLLAIKNLYLYYKNRKYKYVLRFIIVTIINTIIHVSAIALFIVLFLMFIRNSKNKKELFGVIIFAVLITLLGIFLFKNNIGTEKLYLNKGGLDAEKISWIQEASADGRAAYLKGFSSNNIVITIFQIPIRIIYFLYTPFIWMVREVIDLLGLLDAILYIWITFLVLKVYKQRKKKNKKLFEVYLFYAIFAMILMFSIGTSNYGTAIRHRAKLIIPLIVLATPVYKIKMEDNIK